MPVTTLALPPYVKLAEPFKDLDAWVAFLHGAEIPVLGQTADALEALLADQANDAVLVLNVPTALASAPAAAQAVVSTIQRNRASENRRKPVFAVWLGEDERAAEAFESAGSTLWHRGGGRAGPHASCSLQ